MDFLAGACELLGKWIVGNKNRWGFLIQICGSAFWIYVAVTHKLYGLLLVTIGCVVANLRNYRKWGKG
jgi:nicotinamide riboside transporter PnuC